MLGSQERAIRAILLASWSWKLRTGGLGELKRLGNHIDQSWYATTAEDTPFSESGLAVWAPSDSSDRKVCSALGPKVQMVLTLIKFVVGLFILLVLGSVKFRHLFQRAHLFHLLLASPRAE